MTDEQIKNNPNITQREAEALKLLLSMRELYAKTGHALAARVMGVALWLVWKVFSKTKAEA